MARKGRNNYGGAQTLGVIAVLTVASVNAAAQTLPTISSLTPSSVVAGEVDPIVWTKFRQSLDGVTG